LLGRLRCVQLMQAADSISTVSTDSAASDSTTQAPQQPQQLLPVEQERFTVATLRRLLQSPECMQTLRRVGCATAEELAGEAGGGRGVLWRRQAPYSFGSVHHIMRE
jgi:hypothetical protein